MKNKISRREFITKIVPPVALAAASAGSGIFFHNRRLAPRGTTELKHIPDYSIKTQAPALIIAHGTNTVLALKAAINAMGGINKFIMPGDKVLIKPNCAFDRPPHTGATTSPPIVEACVNLCRSAGAVVRVFDNPINNPHGCFVKSGILAATEKAGGKIWLPEQSMVAPVFIGGQKLSGWQVFYEPLKWADKVIGIPTVKSHNLCGASLSMKNWYGFLGGARNSLHQIIDPAVADLGAFIKPTLIILDGSRLLMKNGPTGGSPADVKPGNVIAVGTDPVAIDSFGASLLNLRDTDIKYLQLARQANLGNTDWKRVSGFREITV